jgi:valyl-tRNA synthetase
MHSFQQFIRDLILTVAIYLFIFSKKMNRFDAREKIVEELKELGVYRGKNEKHAMRLARCSRSGDIIEPLVMPQWYIKCDTMAQRALKDAELGNLVFYPDSAIKDWNRSLGKYSIYISMIHFQSLR